ncbi:hypothetical protein [Psychrobacillus sp. FJAT-51614]
MKKKSKNSTAEFLLYMEKNFDDFIPAEPTYELDNISKDELEYKTAKLIQVYSYLIRHVSKNITGGVLIIHLISKLNDEIEKLINLIDISKSSKEIKIEFLLVQVNKSIIALSWFHRIMSELEIKELYVFREEKNHIQLFLNKEFPRIELTS